MIILENDNNNFDYLLDMFEIPDYEKYKGKDVLYHNTWLDNVDSIAENGLKTEKAKQLEYSGNMIWTTTQPGSTGYGGCTVCFDNEPNNENFEQVNDTEVVVWENIPVNKIHFIDTWISEDVALRRVSGIKKLIQKIGIDRVRKTLLAQQEKGVQFFYTIETLLEKLS